MIIEGLTLKNIRSYEDHRLEFHTGMNLIVGDTGQGKSTLLMAMEFALFGPRGGEGMASLLRTKSTKGEVELDLRMSGASETTEIKIHRGINRKRKDEDDQYEQTDTWIEVNGQRLEFSITELNRYVASILQFKEDAMRRRGTDIFEYGIYARQGELIHIIFEKEDVRKEVIRRVFGLKEYKVARDNISLICNSLRQDMREQRGRGSGMEKVEKKMEDKEAKVKDIEEGLKNANRSEKEILKELKGLEKKYESMSKSKKEIDELRTDIEKHKERIIPQKNRLKEVRSKIKGHKEKVSALPQVEKTAKEYLSVKKERESLASDIKGLEEAKQRHQRLTVELEECQKRARNIKKELDEADKGSFQKIPGLEKEIKLRARARENLGEYQSKIKSLEELEKRSEGLKKEVKGKKEVLDKIKDIEKGLEKDSDLKQERDELLSSKEELNGRAEVLKSEMRGLSVQLEEKRKELDDLEGMGDVGQCPRCHQQVTKEHLTGLKEELGKEIKDLEGRIKSHQQAMGQTLSESRKTADRIKDIKSEVEGLEKDREQLAELKRELGSLEEKETELKGAAKELGRREDYESKISELKDELKELEKFEQSLDKLKHQKERYESQEKEWKKLDKRIKELGKKINGMAPEMQKLDGLRKREEELGGQMRELEEDYERYKELKEADKALEDREREEEEVSLSIKDLENKIENISKSLSKKEDGFDSKEFESTNLRIDELKRKKSVVGERIQSDKERLREEKDELDSLRQEYEEKARASEMAELFENLNQWMDRHIITGIEHIEEEAFSKIYTEFRTRFVEYYDFIIGDSELHIDLTKDFNILAYREDAEVDVHSASGGERSAIAMAYRLALNQVLSLNYPPLQQENVLILDEPTANFSSEQIDRFGILLRHLNMKQTIFVTHEREKFKSLADTVYTVKKSESGLSKVGQKQEKW